MVCFIKCFDKRYLFQISH